MGQNMRKMGRGLYLFAGLLLLASCLGNRDEKEIRQVIEHVRSNMETKSYPTALEPVTEDYSDSLNQSKEDIAPKLKRIFKNYETLDVEARISEIKIEGLTATAKTRLKIKGNIGDKQERLFGAQLLGNEFHIHFHKRGSVWKIVGTTIIRKKSLF